MASDLFQVSPLTGLRRIFYFVTPNETSFETNAEVPKYLIEATPFFTSLIILEAAIQLARGKRTVRFNDGIGSMSAGIFQQIVKALFRTLDFAAYIWVYENYRLLSLPWDSPVTWWICFLGVDFAYYWFHRAAHEVNILWASHHVHHSSEDYNLTTALRQSLTQQMFSWAFYVPMALAVPPTHFLVHMQFNLLYQFWIHTEIIYKFPAPLEFILNTPSHHRVHHGRNPYCIDKNYAGTLIIWDRLFGTFEEEKEEVAYGTVHPIETFDPLYTQACHYLHMWRTFWSMSGVSDKLSVIFKGPGWHPGTGRMGDITEVPQVEMPTKVYNPEVPYWVSAYAFLHFLIVTVVYQSVMTHVDNMSWGCFAVSAAFILLSITSFGAMFDRTWYHSPLEVLRCGLFLAAAYLTSVLPDAPLTNWAVHIFWFSLLLWITQAATKFAGQKQHVKSE